MAYADYRHCDVCDSNVFYDSNLDYNQDGDVPEDEIARVNGEKIPFGYKLQYLGDWAVICRDCAKTHKTIVVPIEP